LAAFLPLFVFFECLVQLGGMFTAKLVVQHAASTAARAAVVVIHDDPKYYNNQPVGQASGKRRETVEKAATIVMRSVKSIVKMKLTFPTSAGGKDDKTTFGRDDLVRVRIEAEYRCRVPFASRLICDAIKQRRTLVGEAALPNQGADYPYPTNEDGT
jgi:Flp pilus assembly protein TadG